EERSGGALIDLHLHLLPGVDDGAQSLEEALAMVRIAAGDGCTALVATPHQRRDEWENDDAQRLTERLDEVAARLPRDAVGTVPRLFLGGEVRVDSELLSDLARPGRSGVLSLAGSRYLLLEFEPSGVGPDPVELVRELLAEGWWPIVAHPEVVPFFWQGEDDLLARLVEAGALFQVTAMSVTGEFGKPTKERVWELLRAGCVQFVASDSHRPDWRPPGLAQARKILERELGESVATDLTVTNPRAVVDNRSLAGAEPTLSVVPELAR
ncbi:MAG: CpsB/CapC family capsule biosynthesis tyrosine phosphatase, partial [Thermoanaerobaculia bacterium]